MMEKFSNDKSKILKDMSHIKGWGIDADVDNDPTYPMRQRSDEEKQSVEAEYNGYDWDRPPQQPINMEVLHSNERPNVSAVYGTSVPPSGLSGMIRRFAFRYSEGRFVHWLSLLLADRVNSVEGLVDDIAHGHVPNICAEKGMKAEWQYNQKAVIKKVVVTAAVVGAVAILFSRRK